MSGTRQPLFSGVTGALCTITVRNKKAHAIGFLCSFLGACGKDWVLPISSESRIPPLVVVCTHQALPSPADAALATVHFSCGSFRLAPHRLFVGKADVGFSVVALSARCDLGPGSVLPEPLYATTTPIPRVGAPLLLTKRATSRATYECHMTNALRVERNTVTYSMSGPPPPTGSPVVAADFSAVGIHLGAYPRQGSALLLSVVADALVMSSMMRTPTPDVSLAGPTPMSVYTESLAECTSSVSTKRRRDGESDSEVSANDRSLKLRSYDTFADQSPMFVDTTQTRMKRSWNWDDTEPARVTKPRTQQAPLSHYNWNVVLNRNQPQTMEIDL